MHWTRKTFTEWVWLLLTISCSTLLWNLFFYIKYPEQGISYFWDFLLTPGDWEFRLPVIITIGAIYIARVLVTTKKTKFIKNSIV